MKKGLLYVAMLSAGLALGAEGEATQEAANPVALAMKALKLGSADQAAAQLNAIKNPAAKLFVEARVKELNGEFKEAAKTLAIMIVDYPNSELIIDADLMSARLYMKMGMFDIAKKTAEQVATLYAGSPTEKMAQGLIKKIEEKKQAAGQENIRNK